jgi:hypothetical protein
MLLSPALPFGEASLGANGDGDAEALGECLDGPSIHHGEGRRFRFRLWPAAMAGESVQAREFLVDGLGEGEGVKLVLQHLEWG